MDVGSFRVKDVLYNLDEKGRQPVTTCRSVWVGVNWGGGESSPSPEGKHTRYLSCTPLMLGSDYINYLILTAHPN